MRQYKIAFDLGRKDSGHNVRGIGVNTQELLKALETQRSEDFEISGIDFSKANLTKYDLVHYTSFHPFFLTLPLSKPTKKVVVTIHDLIPLIYPEHYPPGIKGRLRFIEQKRRLRNVDAFITISETSKKDICRFLKVDPNKVSVIYLSPKRIFRVSRYPNIKLLREKYNLPKEFVLYVGDINYNKNIPGLIKAVKLAKIPLVFVGKNALKIEEMALSNHSENKHLKEIIDDINSQGILRVGFVPDEDLAAIYKLASVYCQPSFYEGFGLGILEAQASECPVVAARNQVHVEIAENSCLFADPNNYRDLSKKITQIIQNPELRQELIKKGKENVSKFSWSKTAKKTIEIYRGILNMKH